MAQDAGGAGPGVKAEGATGRALILIPTLGRGLRCSQRPLGKAGALCDLQGSFRQGLPPAELMTPVPKSLEAASVWDGQRLPCFGRES